MKPLTFVFLIFLILFACENDIKDGLTSLINITKEPPSENCPSGGYKIETGFDVNENSILDSDEMQNSVYICNGLTSLVNITAEPPSENCPSGGYKIETGLDLNENSILDSIEIQNSVYICNGTDVIDEISFGEIQTGFSANSIYKADSDGFLSVYYTSSSMYGSIDGFIFSDSTENPQRVVGKVELVPGSTTVPIKENNYWKVASVQFTTVTISWLPIQ